MILVEKCFDKITGITIEAKKMKTHLAFILTLSNFVSNVK